MDARIPQLARVVRSHVVRWVKTNHEVDDNLCGACAIASFALWQVLKAAGFKANFVAIFGSEDIGGHCWVETLGHVIDLTATQFEDTLPEVLIFPLADKRKEPIIYLVGTVYRDKAALHMVSSWTGQSPYLYKRKVARLLIKLGSHYRVESDGAHV